MVKVKTHFTSFQFKKALMAPRDEEGEASSEGDLPCTVG